MSREEGEGEPILLGFAKLKSSSVSDALDRLGIPGHPVGIRPVTGSVRLCGRAFTVHYIPINPGKGETVGDFIDDVPTGSIIVIDNGGRLDATVWGDLMTTVAVRNGLGGTVIDGVSRDTDKARQMTYPIYARSTFMRTGKDRVTVAGTQVAVNLVQHRVNPRDIIIGDSDGIVVIPADRAEDVLALAQAIDEAEEGIRALLAEGLRLDEARAQYGYHQLQAKNSER